MITVKIYPNKTLHAAKHNDGKIELLCSSLHFSSYYIDLNNQDAATKENVTCKKCLKQMEE